MPEPQSRRRKGGMRSLSAICGAGGTGATTKRPVLSANYKAPALPFKDRMKWLTRVQRLVAGCTAKRESYPHKVIAVANAMARIGDECRLSFEGIAERAGCVERTVQACINWLEAQGALTWTNTARRHTSGRWVRSHNLYLLVLDFAGFLGLVTRVRRAIWRERPKGVSNGNGCRGLPVEFTYQEQVNAQRRLARIRKERQTILDMAWVERRTIKV